MFTEPELRRLEEAVRAAEARTSAEIIMVLASRSGRYLDLALIFGLALSYAALAVIVYASWEFSPHSVIPLTLTTQLAGTVACQLLPWSQKLLCTRARLERETRGGARRAFLDHEVGALRERNGILVYYSALEGRIELLPDLGIQGRVPDHRWIEPARRFHGSTAGSPAVDRLVTLVADVGMVLQEALPARSENPNESPDRPRVCEA